MGLIRTAIKTLPYIAVFSLGYYFGSVKSDNYDCVFKNSSTERIYNNSGFSFKSDSLDRVVNTVDNDSVDNIVEPYVVEDTVVSNVVDSVVVDSSVEYYTVLIKDFFEKNKINN